MSNRPPTSPPFFSLTVLVALGFTVAIWRYPTCQSWPLTNAASIALAWLPASIFMCVFGLDALHERLRAPDAVITVMPRMTVVRRDAETRKAWLNRPGSYGK